MITEQGPDDIYDQALNQPAGTDYGTDDAGNIYDYNSGAQVGNISQVMNWMNSNTPQGVLNSVTGNAPSAATVQTVTQGAAAGDSGAMSTLDSLVKNFPAILTGINALELSQINLQRGKQGLPPLNPAAYGPSISFGLTSQTMMMIGVAVAALIFLRK